MEAKLGCFTFANLEPSPACYLVIVLPNGAHEFTAEVFRNGVSVVQASGLTKSAAVLNARYAVRRLRPF